MASLLINPRKRRKSAKRKYRKNPISVAAKNPIRRRRRRAAMPVAFARRKYRSNPISVNSLKNDLMSSAKDGAVGAIGAVMAEVLISKLPLPAGMQSGVGLTLVKGLAGVAVGFAASKIIKNKRVGTAMANGAMVIALHDTIRGALKGPLGLSGNGLLGYGNGFDDDTNGLLGYYSSSNPQFNATPNMGYYTSTDDFN